MLDSGKWRSKRLYIAESFQKGRESDPDTEVVIISTNDAKMQTCAVVVLQRPFAKWTHVRSKGDE